MAGSKERSRSREDPINADDDRSATSSKRRRLANHAAVSEESELAASDPKHRPATCSFSSSHTRSGVRYSKPPESECDVDSKHTRSDSQGSKKNRRNSHSNKDNNTHISAPGPPPRRVAIASQRFGRHRAAARAPSPGRHIPRRSDADWPRPPRHELPVHVPAHDWLSPPPLAGWEASPEPSSSVMSNHLNSGGYQATGQVRPALLPAAADRAAGPAPPHRPRRYIVPDHVYPDHVLARIRLFCPASTQGSRISGPRADSNDHYTSSSLPAISPSALPLATPQLLGFSGAEPASPVTRHLSPGGSSTRTDASTGGSHMRRSRRHMSNPHAVRGVGTGQFLLEPRGDSLTPSYGSFGDCPDVRDFNRRHAYESRTRDFHFLARDSVNRPAEMECQYLEAHARYNYPPGTRDDHSLRHRVNIIRPRDSEPRGSSLSWPSTYYGWQAVGASTPTNVAHATYNDHSHGARSPAQATYRQLMEGEDARQYSSHGPSIERYHGLGSYSPRPNRNTNIETYQGLGSYSPRPNRNINAARRPRDDNTSSHFTNPQRVVISVNNGAANRVPGGALCNPSLAACNASLGPYTYQGLGSYSSRPSRITTRPFPFRTPTNQMSPRGGTLPRTPRFGAASRPATSSGHASPSRVPSRDGMGPPAVVSPEPGMRSPGSASTAPLEAEVTVSRASFDHPPSPEELSDTIARALSSPVHQQVVPTSPSI